MQSGNQAKTFQASDIKKLVQQNGRVTIGDQEFVLKSPDHTDPKLLSIINDPNFSVKTVGANASYGDAECELTGNGQTVRITFSAK